MYFLLNNVSEALKINIIIINFFNNREFKAAFKNLSLNATENEYVEIKEQATQTDVD